MIGIDETCEMIASMGGFCKGYVVDISKKEEVYRIAKEIKEELGDVSLFNTLNIARDK